MLSVSAKKFTHLRQLTYVAGFLLNLHLALSAYINSSFLATFMPERMVGLVFALAALISVIAIFKDEDLVAKYGDIKFSIFLILLLIISVYPLANSTNIWLLTVSFIIYFALGSVLRFNFDLYLENLSDEANTGRIRGLFLTIINLAWLSSPLIVGELTGNNEYWKVYIASGLVTLPLFYIALFKLRDLKHTHAKEEYNTEPILRTLKKLWRGRTAFDRDIYRVLVCTFLLNFFYAVMVIYSPVYLHNHMGIGWLDIGKILTMMLVPFVLVELPLGRLADRIGEKEILAVAFGVMIVATGIITFLTSSSWLVWGLILFATRIGAAGVEVMCDSYLFKRISNKDINLVALSRNCYPGSYIIAPIIAFIFLEFFSIRYIFLALAVLLFLGLYQAIKLRDTA